MDVNTVMLRQGAVNSHPCDHCGFQHACVDQISLYDKFHYCVQIGTVPMGIRIPEKRAIISNHILWSPSEIKEARDFYLMGEKIRCQDRVFKPLRDGVWQLEPSQNLYIRLVLIHAT